MSAPQNLARRAVAKVFALVRRNPPCVLLTPGRRNGGNFPDLRLTAWSATYCRIHPTRAMWVPNMEPWLEELPALRERMIHPGGGIKLTDAWDISWGQDVNVGFLKPEIRRFVPGVRLNGSRFLEHLESVDQQALVVRARWGNCCLVPQHRSKFGMNVRRAGEQASHAEGERVVLTPADPAWCREHLDFLEGRASGGPWAPPHDTFQDLAQTVAARGPILSDCVFSYEGGYVACVEKLRKTVPNRW